jgi:type I restriction enzyme M protein
MPKLSLAKLERHLYAAADRLRQEGLDAATYKDYIFKTEFVVEYLGSLTGQARMLAGTGGSIIRHIDIFKLVVVLVPQPNGPEQLAIAASLKTSEEELDRRRRFSENSNCLNPVS